jgi:hypothetical protein
VSNVQHEQNAFWLVEVLRRKAIFLDGLAEGLDCDALRKFVHGLRRDINRFSDGYGLPRTSLPPGPHGMPKNDEDEDEGEDQ